MGVPVGAIQNDLPFPMVKKAIISGFGPKDGLDYFWLDGHNNSGFSGGPIVLADSSQIPQIIGVVSGYQVAPEPILHEGQRTPYYYDYNTGIIKAFNIKHAIDAIRQMPIGCSIT